MVRIRQGFSETVQFSITGPKSILPKSVTVEAKLNQTWMYLLNQVLELQIGPESGIFVCSCKYCPNAPTDRGGWRCELQEQIVEFVRKFERKRKQYSVRLCYENDTLPPSRIVNVVNNITPSLSNSHIHNQGLAASTDSSGEGKRINSLYAFAKTIKRGPTIVVPIQSKLTPIMPSSKRSTDQSFFGNRVTDLTPLSRPNPISSLNTNVLSHLKNQQKTQPGLTTAAQSASKRRLSEPAGKSACASVPRKSQRIQNKQQDGSSKDERNTSITINKVTGALKVEPPPDVLELEPAWARNWDDSDNEEWGQRQSLDSGVDTDNNVEHNQNNDIPDNMSSFTAASVEEEELRQLGIQVENIKPAVDNRFNNMSNAFLLRLRREYQRLRDDGSWLRNVNRAPLSSFLIQEMFRL